MARRLVGLPKRVGEFEAESVAFLVCSRIGIDNPSHEYLSRYVKNYSSIPAISLDLRIEVSWTH